MATTTRCPGYEPKMESLCLPTSDPHISTDVVYLFKPNSLSCLQSSPLYHLQRVRRNDNSYAQEYKKCEQEFVKALVSRIDQIAFDAIVCVPSSRPELQAPYRDAILLLKPGVADYSSCISRVNDGIDSSTDKTFEERVDNFQLDIDSLPDDVKLLVIDDILRTGSSAAAVMKRFQITNASVSSFSLVCALWITGDLGDQMRSLLQASQELLRSA